MKKLYAILILSVSASFANATIRQVTVGPASFNPSTVNALCGDTIAWTLVSGSHTTTSTTIPVCAVAWDAPINATTPAYAIVVSCLGTYNYKCTPHGFTGSIVVTGTCSSGVPSINTNFISTAYPNPFNNKVTIETPAADLICVYNAVGEKIKTIALQKGQIKAEVNTSDLTDGLYFYAIIKEGVVIETRKIVKN